MTSIILIKCKKIFNVINDAYILTTFSHVKWDFATKNANNIDYGNVEINLTHSKKFLCTITCLHKNISFLL